MAGGWRFGPRWDLATTLRLASGFPRTPVLGLRVSAVEDASGALVPERDPSGDLVYTTDLGSVANLNSGRLPLFARLDLRLSFRPGGTSGRWLFYLDIINATGRENVGAYEALLEHDPTADQPRLVESPSQALPLLPSFGVRVRS